MKKLLLIITVVLFSFAAKAQEVQNSFEDNFTENCKIQIYPNPVTDMTFKISSEIDILKIEILNVIGQNIQTIESNDISKLITINLNASERGIYLVKILFTNDKSLIKKILVK